MNINTRSALAEDSPQRMDVIEKLATAQARSDKKYRPITLELTNVGIGQHMVGGWDTFDIHIRELSEGGRSREQRSVVIVDKFADFVDHPDYTGLMIHIPATDHNLRNLVTSHMENKWTIKQQDIADLVAERAKDVVPVRDAVAETQQPDHMGHVDDEIDVLQRRIDELRRMNEIQAQPAHVAQPAVPAPPPEEPQESVEVQVSKIHVDDTELTKRARDAVHAEHSEEIEKLKAKAKNWWLTKEYKDFMTPLVEAKKDELCTQPVK